MKSLDKRLMRLLIKTKAQFAAVAVVLAIGIMTFVMLNFSARNLEMSVDRYYQQTGFADVFCEVMRLPEAKLDALNHIDGVEVAVGRVIKEVGFDNGSDQRATVRLVSYDRSAGLNDVYLLRGQLASGDDEIMLLKLFAEAIDCDVGDDFVAIIDGRKKVFKVSAIVSNPEYIYLIEDEQELLPDLTTFGVGYVSESFAQRQFGFNRAYNNLYFKTKLGVDQSFIVNQLEKELEDYGVLRIFQRDGQISARMTAEEIDQNKKTANVVPFVFVVVAALIIAVMINRLVKGDRMAIGVLKALGYNSRTIIIHYTKYGFLIGLSGSVVGMIAGVLLSFQIVKLYMSIYDIPLMIGRIFPEVLLLGIVLGSLFCVAAGLYGARGIIKIDPAESMRPEAPKVGKRIFLESLTFIWRRVSFSWKVVLRNMLRSKKRMAFIILGVALTYAVMLMPVYLIDSFFSMFSRQYGEMYKMDYTVKFSQNVDRQAIVELKRLIGSDQIEGQIEFPFEIQNGWKKKTVNVIGINRQTEMYRFKDLASQPVAIPETGVVVTEGLARLLSIDVGDEVIVGSFLPGRDDVNLAVTGIVKQQLGVNAYMNIDYMRRTLLESGYINSAIIVADQLDKYVFEDMKNVKAVQSLYDMKAVFKKFTRITVAVYGIMVILAGLLGFAIIYNATIMSINERQLEFSSMRVMGFDKGAIFRIVMRENILLSCFGIALGVPLGAKLVDGVALTFSNELYTIEVIDNPIIYVYTALFVGIFVLIAQVATYNKIHHLNFIDALKARMT